MTGFAQWLQATAFSDALRSADWIVPLLQSIHIVMIGVVFVSVSVLALRVLGRVRVDEAPADVWARFRPWLWGGLIVMLVTGALLAIGEPVRQVQTLSFWLKMALIVVGAVAAARFGGMLAGVTVVGPHEFSNRMRLAAIATIVLWLAIIFLGRAIGWDVEIWGSWSPSFS